MGISRHSVVNRHFGLRELGILEGPPLRGADTIVRTAAELFKVRGAVFLAFDDVAGCASIRASAQKIHLRDVPLADSLSAWIRTENASLVVASTEQEVPRAPERPCLNAASFIGTPVHGPDKEAIGVLAAIHSSPKEWTRETAKKLEDLAHLISQEIMLRASFETLRIMSSSSQTLKS